MSLRGRPPGEKCYYCDTSGIEHRHGCPLPEAVSVQLQAAAVPSDDVGTEDTAPMALDEGFLLDPRTWVLPWTPIDQRPMVVTRVAGLQGIFTIEDDE